MKTFQKSGRIKTGTKYIDYSAGRGKGCKRSEEKGEGELRKENLQLQLRE